MKILIVEDNTAVVETMVGVLERHGHQVQVLSQVYQCQCGHLEGLDADGQKSEVDSVDLAFVDGELSFSPLQGWDIIPQLKENGATVIGTSGGGTYNHRLHEAGADQTVPKEWVTGPALELCLQHHVLKSL